MNKINPKNQHALIGKGIIAFENSRFEEALKYF